MRRYFFGLVAFAVVVAWLTAGATTALLALTACALIVAGPKLLARSAPKPKSRPRPARTRPLHEELPLVPDDPSLIVELV